MEHEIDFLHSHHKVPNLICIFLNHFLNMISMEYKALILTVSSQLPILDLESQKSQKFSLIFFAKSFKHLHFSLIHHDPELLLSIFGRGNRGKHCIRVHVQEVKHPWKLKLELVLCILEPCIHHHSSQGAYWKRFEAWQCLEARDFKFAHQEVGFLTSLILQIIMSIL